MYRYKLIIEYDGSKFHGFQKQLDCITVQETLEKAIWNFCQTKVEIVAAGRTDAGVHALGQVIHFDLPYDYPLYKIQNAINFYTKISFVSILSVEQKNENFHARFSAKSRSYRYIILNRNAPSALMYNRAWHIKYPLDYNIINSAAQNLIGQHDFTSFRARECQASSPIKTISQINISKDQDLIYIDITAPSFLHHMVRNIVGSLIKVGNNKWTSEYLLTVLKAKNRNLAGETAPPWGLYFVKAEY